MSCTSSQEFRAWLATNHRQSDGIWLRIYKKGSGVASVAYAQALDQVLCFGWIDGQKKPYKELGKNKKAKAFFETLNKTNLYSIVYRLQTAKKPETREKWKQRIIEMLARGEKFH